jgi:hypothetical protein
MVTEYFARYPIERAEDWHRSLSILIASEAVRLTGTVATIKILHILYLGIFAVLLFSIIRLAALDAPVGQKDAPTAQAATATWIALATLAALALSPAGLLILSRTAMEDPLAGGLALAGLLLTLRHDNPVTVGGRWRGRVLRQRFLGKGSLFALDGPWLFLILLVGLLAARSHLTRTKLITAFIPAIVAAPIAAGKLLWNHADLGTFLPTLALTENRVYIYGSIRGTIHTSLST